MNYPKILLIITPKGKIAVIIIENQPPQRPDMSEEGKSAYVKLISAEGHEFIVDRRCAMVSGTVRAMLEGARAVLALSWYCSTVDLDKSTPWL